MALRKFNPTSPGRRFMTTLTFDEITKSSPEKALTEPRRRTGGRTNRGRISIWFRGGGHKRRYRVVDFRRDKHDVPAKVAAIEYDPNRSARLALLHYVDGEKRYILWPEGLAVGATVVAGEGADILPGNCLPPGELRMVGVDCHATIGQVGNLDHKNVSVGKAGRTRWKGRRPHNRGVSMNPVDHPHGGGEGKTSGGRHPVTPWGKPTKGYKTRNNKRTQKFIVKRRK